MTTLRAGSATDVGQIRANNQDSSLIVAASSLFGVADGMGGHQGGEVASAMAVELTQEHASEPTLESLKAAVRVANRAIFEKAGSDRDLHGMGTTLVAVQLVEGPEGEEIAWVNVGDSRVYLLRDDELLQLSDDHSLVEDLVRDGQLTQEEAAVHPQRNILTRALGIDMDVDVDGATVLPFTGDRFLLCSDGLFNEVSTDQMASVLRRLADPDEAAAELVRLANEGGGRDNITVVVVDVVDDGGRAAAASALLAEQATTAVPMGQPEVDPDAEPGEPGRADPDDEAAGAAPVFADRRSSLPDSDDDYASDTEDPFGELDRLRSRRFTWRVVVFLVLLLAIGGAVVGAIGWRANNTYFVTYEGQEVAVFKGRQGGFLWIQPRLEDRMKLNRSEIPPPYREDVADGVEFSSRRDADRYVARLQGMVSDREAEREAATTTTTPASTSSTTAPAPTTTAPATTTSAPGP